MGFVISHTDMKLGFENTPARLEMQTRRARIDLHPNNASLDIKREPPRVLIDQYECFAEEGLKNNIDLLKETSQRAYEHIMEYIGKTAEDGKRLAAIERGGNPIAEIAKRDASPLHEFALAIIPKARPKIDVTGGIWVEPVLDSNGATHSLSAEYTPASLDVNYIPGRLDIYVKQYAAVNIQYEGNTIDKII